ncbi:MAG: ATPase, T2SS/T4P/T4SS family [Bryobacterales bacterium]|nr:ATPase, T2SS/T4P/T4SS family [Bryobacterales bacterium]
MLNLADVLAQLPPAVRAPFADAAVTEVMLNSDGTAWYERQGRVEAIAGVEVSDKAREGAAVAIARPLGFPADEAHPLADARLPDGSRVAVTCPPVVLSHEIVVRRFGSPPLSLSDLVRSGSVDLDTCELALEAIGARRNVLVSGGTSSGKTTLLQALAGELDRRERVIVIEDTRELDLSGLPNCSRWEARRGRDDAGLPSVTVRRLVRHALRARPDRIFVGEVRGSEALDLLQALNTGHGGSLSTLHAPSARAAPGRLAACAMQARDGLPWDAVCMMVGAAVDVICHVERDWKSGRRRVAECVELRGFDARRGEWIWGEARRPQDLGRTSAHGAGADF